MSHGRPPQMLFKTHLFTCSPAHLPHMFTCSPFHMFTCSLVLLFSTRLEGAALPGPNGAAWWARWKDLRTKDSSRENQVENLPKGELCTNQRREYGRLLFVQVTRPSPDDPNWFGKLLFTFCNSGCELSELGELVFFLFHTTSLLRNLWKSRRVDVEMRTLQEKTGLNSPLFVPQIKLLLQEKTRLNPLQYSAAYSDHPP